MDIGAHLPLIDFGAGPPTAADLTAYARCCVDLGYAAIAANDHLVFARPWLDGLTALAAVLGSSGNLSLATTVALPVVRGPVPLATALATLDVLSGGRVIAAVGPGSSPLDYAAVGLDFQERWNRLDDAIPTMRALWRGETYDGRYYSTRGNILSPAPAHTNGPPLWLGSWGSPTGLRRVARLADGWLASAYHTTPAAFEHARTRIADERKAAGATSTLPNAVATFFFHLTHDRYQARQLLERVLSPALNRDPAMLADRLAIGPPELLTERLTALQQAGAQRVYLWPLENAHTQLQQARNAWPSPTGE